MAFSDDLDLDLAAAEAHHAKGKLFVTEAAVAVAPVGAPKPDDPNEIVPDEDAIFAAIPPLGNSKGKNLSKFIRTVKPYIRHIHFADAYGLDGEGVPIGEGDIDFARIMPLFADYEGTWVPEIWRGHLNRGQGFLEALIKLKEYDI